jgi:C4-dicarboxylate-binding protein DctP
MRLIRIEKQEERMNKKILWTMALLLLIGCVSVFAAGAVETGATPEKPAVFKGGVTGNPDWQYTKALKEWSAAVKERTNGAVIIEVYPSEQLGSERELLERTNLGVIDFCLVGAGGGAEFVAEFAMFENAFTFQSLKHFENVAFDRSFRDNLAAMLESKSNMTFIGLSLNGVRSVLSNRAFRTPQEAAGLRLRIPDVATFRIVAAAIGAAPTPLPFGEVYMALQQGVVDAVESNPEGMINMKFVEVTKHLIITEHMMQGLGHFFNKNSFYGKLSKAQQEILIDSAFEIMHKYFTNSAKVQADYLAKIKANYGLNVIELTPAEKAVFQQRAVAELQKEYIPKWGSLWKQFQELAK